ncbi:MAG TPA: HAD-IIIA family hydrolase [Actinomycetes bacterium]|nr:HAD-IIIA family hydrolase [Actinomycetes bacterium]
MTGDWDAVFVDRDGTLNAAADPGGYVLHPQQVRLLDGAGAAVARLNERGIEVHVVTNQRCVALGLLDDSGLVEVNRALCALLAAEGARVDSIQVCPHDIGSCACRKPADGLVRRVLEQRPYLRGQRCVVVGDSPSDARVGDRLGLLRVLVGRHPDGAPADLVADDLADAVERLLSRPTPRRLA